MLIGGRRVNPLAFLILFSSVLVLPTPAQAIPTFNRDVAPILFGNCAICHRPGGAGPFSLLTYGDATKHRREIVDATQSGFMPPWPPERGYGDFEDERRLTPEQIQTIASWVRTGASEGSREDLPAKPVFDDGWQLGKPDLVVTAAAPFRIPAKGSDVFWNFTFAPQIDVRHYIRAVEIRPEGWPGSECKSCGAESVSSLHHANALIDRTGSAERLESKPGAGFEGMELTLDRNPFDPPSHFLFWKPGNKPYFELDGLSWLLDPGNKIVLNTHLQPSGKPETIQPSIGLYFTDKPPTKFPVLLELEHDEALNIPAGRRDFTVSDDFRLPVDVDVLAIYPHAHYLGKILEAYATLPDGNRKCLIRIPSWNLAWQAVYRYRQPVFLPKGTLISMRFQYDNSVGNPRNPNAPPKRVRSGNNASDEMGHLWLQVLPCGHGDKRRELEESLVRHRLEKSPNDSKGHVNLGALLLSRLRTQDAITELETAIRLDASRPEPHDMLGSALRSVGRTQDALAEYRLALRIDPRYINARYNLAITLARTGDIDGAISNLQQVIDAFPGSSRLQNELGEMLERKGDLPGALSRFNTAIKLEPSNRDAVNNRDSMNVKLHDKTNP